MAWKCLRLKNMLKHRVITGVVLLLIVLSALFAQSSIYWRIFISLMLLVGFWEWLAMCGIQSRTWQIFSYLLFAIISYLIQAGFVSLHLLVPIACLAWLGIIGFTVSTHLDFLHQPVAKLLLGIAVLAIGGWFVIELRNIEHGAYWILCLFVSIWAADIGAYFFGRKFGKTKLAPTVSPSKTWEGLIGGLILVTLIFVPLLFYWFSPTSAFLLLLVVLTTAVISVFGDLFESKLKRHAGIKDSSQILPGHGGVLDRIDSLLAGVPFFVMGLIYLGYM